MSVLVTTSRRRRAKPNLNESLGNLIRSLAPLLMAACIGSSAWPARAEDEMNVGHNAAGQLQVQVDFEQPLGLPVSVFPGSPGFFCGTAPFDTHPLWNLVSGRLGVSYSLTLKLHDVNGVYADSDPIVLTFTPEPPLLAIKPASLGFVTVSWEPATPGLVLQFSPALLPAAWTNAPSGATNPVTLKISSPARFYRLKK